MSIERIRSLEAISRRLEPALAERTRLNDRVIEYANRFLDNIYSIPAFVMSEEQGAGLSLSPIGEEPADIETLLRLIGEQVDRPGLNPASGGHLGYIPGGGIFYSALGDYLADVTNRYAGIFFASPGAVRMENMLIQWMASVAGYPSGTSGNLTSGGSIANLIGIVTARDAQGITSAEVKRSVIYLTNHAHHSIDKAIRIAGLGECPVRAVPMDSRYRMDAGALDRLIAADLKSGLRPWLVISAAGTTDAGAVDPLPAISDIAGARKLWHHVDGAYGAFFVLCEEGKRMLKGMERSDSLVMDPHKGLFLPYGSGAVLVKNAAQLSASHHYTANYMQDAARSAEELSPADLSPELTKHFRGMRLWLALKLAGLAPFRAGLEEKLLLARYFHEQVSKIPGFAAGPAPDLSVVTFRYIPKKGDPKEFNERLVREVHRDGRVFLSSTVIEGTYILRMAALAFRTHLQTIDLALDILKEKVRLIESAS